MNDTGQRLSAIMTLIETGQMLADAIKPHLEKASTAELHKLFENTNDTTIEQYIIEVMSGRTDGGDASRNAFLSLLTKTAYFHTQDLLCIAAAKRRANNDETPLIIALCKYANSGESYDALKSRLALLETSELPPLVNRSAHWQQELVIRELLTRVAWPDHFRSVFAQNLDTSRPKYCMINAAKNEPQITAKMLYTLMRTRWQSDKDIADLFCEKLQGVPIAQQIKWYKDIGNKPGRDAIVRSIAGHPEDIDTRIDELFAYSLKIGEARDAIYALQKKSSIRALLFVRQKTNDQQIINALSDVFERRVDELKSFVR